MGDFVLLGAGLGLGQILGHTTASLTGRMIQAWQLPPFQWANPLAQAAAEPRPVLTPAQAAALIDATEADVLYLIDEGELPARQIGGQWRVAQSAVVRWLNEG